MNNEILKAAYVDLLKNVDPAYLDIPDKRINGPKGLSGLFLASVSDDYGHAQNKVMIIGSETAGWEPMAKAKKINGNIAYDDFQSIHDYVDRTMLKHQKFFDKILEKNLMIEVILSITSPEQQPRLLVKRA